MATLVSARRADQVVNVRLRLTAQSPREVSLVSPYFYFAHVFLFDPVSKRKYPLLKDSAGNYQGQPLSVNMDGGAFIHDWNKTTLVSFTFQAPPDSVQRVDLMMLQFLPFEGVALEGLGGAATGGIAAAGTTLGLEGALKELKAEVTATEIQIDLAADVLFDFDKATIKPRPSRACATSRQCSRPTPARRSPSRDTPTPRVPTRTTRRCRNSAPHR